MRRERFWTRPLRAISSAVFVVTVRQLDCFWGRGTPVTGGCTGPQDGGEKVGEGGEGGGGVEVEEIEGKGKPETLHPKL